MRTLKGIQNDIQQYNARQENLRKAVKTQTEQIASLEKAIEEDKKRLSETKYNAESSGPSAVRWFLLMLFPIVAVAFLLYSGQYLQDLPQHPVTIFTVIIFFILSHNIWYDDDLLIFGVFNRITGVLYFLATVYFEGEMCTSLAIFAFVFHLISFFMCFCMAIHRLREKKRYKSKFDTNSRILESETAKLHDEKECLTQMQSELAEYTTKYEENMRVLSVELYQKAIESKPIDFDSMKQAADLGHQEARIRYSMYLTSSMEDVTKSERKSIYEIAKGYSKAAADDGSLDGSYLYRKQVVDSEAMNIAKWKKMLVFFRTVKKEHSVSDYLYATVDDTLQDIITTIDNMESNSGSSNGNGTFICRYQIGDICTKKSSSTSIFHCGYRDVHDCFTCLTEGGLKAL